jgi:hypothetical protein
MPRRTRRLRTSRWRACWPRMRPTSSPRTRPSTFSCPRCQRSRRQSGQATEVMQMEMISIGTAMRTYFPRTWARTPQRAARRPDSLAGMPGSADPGTRTAWESKATQGTPEDGGGGAGLVQDFVARALGSARSVRALGPLPSLKLWSTAPGEGPGGTRGSLAGEDAWPSVAGCLSGHESRPPGLTLRLPWSWPCCR